MQNIEYKTQKDFSVDELEQLFLSVEWYLGKYPDKLIAAMKNSSVVFSAWDENILIGLVSALDDGATTVYIPNLLVNPAYQGQGIGKTLLKMMTEHYKGYLGIGLIAEKEKAPFYEHCGFKVEEKQVPIFLITPYDSGHN